MTPTEGRLTPEATAESINVLRNAVEWRRAEPGRTTYDMMRHWSVLAEDIERVLAELDAERKERDLARQRSVRARSALENWGRHHPWCDAVRNVNLPGDCNCGYVAAVNDANPVNVANSPAKDGDV